MINDTYYKRRYVIAGIAIAVVAIYIVRLFALQIVDQSRREKADNNALVRQPVYAARGLIYDRNDSLLVFNQPIYEVLIIMREMGSNFDTLSFCQCLSIDTVAYRERISQISDRRKNRGFSKYTPQVFMGQLKKEDISLLQERLYSFPGVSIRKRTLRDYTYNSACHILGSVGEVNERDLERDPSYRQGDYSGRDGVEKQYEKQLRGENGVEVLLRDSRGRIQGSYNNGEEDRTPTAGINLHLGIDIDIQSMAEELIGEHIGSAVAIEPQTGEILALVSMPGWNPKDLVGKARGNNYMALLGNPSKPLMNRATQAMYPPGSTFKTLQTLVALDQGGITPDTRYPCNGPQSTPIKCTHHHGSPVDLGMAIEQSCNPYYWCAFRDLLQMDGYGKGNKHFRHRYELWREGIMRFGLGQKFEDSDVPDQKGGSIPSTKLYDRFYGKTGWKAITIRSLSIGQGEVLVTPLQLANQAACIANEGYYITPHLLHNDSTYLQADKRHETGIDGAYFKIVKDGMERVMTNGTGRWHNVPKWHICGKTGTVQNSHGKDHAIFIGYAPKDNPKIAVAIAVENVGFGATWACPVAVKMIDAYLSKHYPELADEEQITENRE
ncbi:MAG: penicillin-binding protein 2 [Paludibacteraceae bacterium]|nr:penicillin-binding protein 2 [Paludibacteraceae bacterium]